MKRRQSLRAVVITIAVLAGGLLTWGVPARADARDVIVNLTASKKLAHFPRRPSRAAP